MKYSTPSFQGLCMSSLLALALLLVGTPAHADTDILHTYIVSKGHEIDNLIAVDASKLAELLPEGYAMVPASEFGVGEPDQGIVVIVNFEGLDPVIDNRPPSAHNRVGIDVTVLVTEPADAAEAGVAFPGAFHLYTLAMYSNEPPFVASLRQTGMPIVNVPHLVYQREIDDVSGTGELLVEVPTPRSALASHSTAFGFGPPAGQIHAIFWHDGLLGRTALHFDAPVFRQANAISRVYTQPGSALAALLEGGGAGPCPPDPETGFTCVIAPSLSISFDQGDIGQLLLIR